MSMTLRSDEPLQSKTGTRNGDTVEYTKADDTDSAAELFVHIARSTNLDNTSDWSVHRPG